MTTIAAADRAPTTGRLAGLLLKLRVALTISSMSMWGRVVYLIAILLGAFVAVGGVLAVLALRSIDGGTDLIAVAGAVMATVGAVGSVATGSSQYSLDPRRLVLLPIPQSRLMAAYLASSLLTIPSAVTFVVSLAPVGYADGPVTGVALIVAGLVQWLLVMMTGRTLVTGLDSLLGGRRSRDLAAVVTALFGLTAGIATQLLTLNPDIAEQIIGLRSVTRWLPWGLGGEAIALLAEGRTSSGLVWLGAATAAVAGLFAVWSTLTVRNLQVRPESPAGSHNDALIIGPLRPFRAGPVIAAWSRSLRQLRRDVRELVEMASLLPLAVVAGLPAIGLAGSVGGSVVIWAGAAGSGVTLVSLNLFGADGPDHAVDQLVARDLTAVVWGKVLSRITVIAFVLLAVVTGLAVATGGWAQWPIGIGLMAATTAVGSAAGLQVSVRSPIPLPKSTAFTGFNNNAADLSQVPVRLGLLIASGFGSLATVAFVFLLYLAWPPAAYGATIVVVAIAIAILVWSVRSAGAYLNRHRPEFLARLKRRSG